MASSRFLAPLESHSEPRVGGFESLFSGPRLEPRDSDAVLPWGKVNSPIIAWAPPFTAVGRQTWLPPVLVRF